MRESTFVYRHEELLVDMFAERTFIAVIKRLLVCVYVCVSKRARALASLLLLRYIDREIRIDLYSEIKKKLIK